MEVQFNSVTGNLLKLAQQQATIDETQQQTSLMSAETQQLVKQMKMDDQSEQVRQQYLAKKRALDERDTPPPSVQAASVMFQGTAQQTIQPLEDQRKALLNDINASRELARSEPNPKLVDKYEKDVTAKESKLSQLDNDLAKARKEFIAQDAAIAGAANKDNMAQIDKEMTQLHGSKWSEGQDLDRDLLGRPKWGTKTAQFFATQQKKGETAEQQANNSLRESNLRIAEAREKEAAEAHRQSEFIREQVILLERERIDIMRDKEARIAQAAQDKKDRQQRLEKEADPNSKAVKTLGDSFAKDLDLIPQHANRMASDVLSRRNEIMQDDPDLDKKEAEEKATKEIKDKYYHPGVVKPAQTFAGFEYSSEKEGKAYYGTTPPKGSKEEVKSQPKTADDYLKGLTG